MNILNESPCTRREALQTGLALGSLLTVSADDGTTGERDDEWEFSPPKILNESILRTIEKCEPLEAEDAQRLRSFSVLELHEEHGPETPQGYEYFKARMRQLHIRRILVERGILPEGAYLNQQSWNAILLKHSLNHKEAPASRDSVPTSALRECFEDWLEVAHVSTG